VTGMHPTGKTDITRRNRDMKTVCTIPASDITAVILAGGRARRMDGADKGLLDFRDRPLIGHVIAAIAPQVGSLLISANRNLERYREHGFPVVTDCVGSYAGPLAGIASGMQAASSPFILCVPCDAPFVPDNLAGVLARTLAGGAFDICVAHDGIRMQQLFALLRCDLLPDLLNWLEAGGHKVEDWYREQRLACADFAAMPGAFANLNTADDARRYATPMTTARASGQ
jgi:molybdopterin-guanine dinucleotide biosynthesis protein A